MAPNYKLIISNNYTYYIIYIIYIILYYYKAHCFRWNYTPTQMKNNIFILSIKLVVNFFDCFRWVPNNLCKCSVLGVYS